jgi:hypothetical protein
MESTMGLPGRNWSTGTGTSPAKGTGAAGVRKIVKTARKNAGSRHRIMNDLRMRGCLVLPRSSHWLDCFILFLSFNLISTGTERVFASRRLRFRKLEAPAG